MEIINVLKEAPYRAEGMGRQQLAEEDYLLLMQAALLAGQAVPVHRADSNVRILILEGELSLTLDGKETKGVAGDLIPATPGTEMNIVNRSSENTTFLIIKTPHPRQWRSSQAEG